MNFAKLLAECWDSVVYLALPVAQKLEILQSTKTDFKLHETASIEPYYDIEGDFLRVETEFYDSNFTFIVLNNLHEQCIGWILVGDEDLTREGEARLQDLRAAIVLMLRLVFAARSAGSLPPYFLLRENLDNEIWCLVSRLAEEACKTAGREVQMVTSRESFLEYHFFANER